MTFLKAQASFLPNLPMAKQHNKLGNGVTLEKINRTTYELGLVVMSLGIFYRVSLLLSFVEKYFCK